MATVGGAQIPLGPPFSKGEVLFQDFNPSLEKRGRGDFGYGEVKLCREFLRQYTCSTPKINEISLMTIQQLHTYCAMCISRCGVVATVEDGRLTKVNADPAHPNGCICVKGTAAPEIVYSADRLQYPMKRTKPKGEADPGWV